MRFMRARLLLSLIVAAAAFTVLPVGTAAAATPSGTTCGTMNTGYVGATGCYSSTTVMNNNWTIVNSTLQVTGSYGWVSTFTFQQKTSVNGSKPSTSTGTVTDTTEYGTSTISFTAPSGSSAPFGVAGAGGYTLTNGVVIPEGNIYADGSSAQGQAIFNAQYDMVYNQGGQNAGYWFGSP